MNSTNFYIQTEQPINADQLDRKLRATGVTTAAVRTTSPITDGYIITDLLLGSIWNHDSGYDDCDSTCPPERLHKAWQDLTERQRQAFSRKFITHIEDGRYNGMLPEYLLQDDDAFQDVMVVHHDAERETATA